MVWMVDLILAQIGLVEIKKPCYKIPANVNNQRKQTFVYVVKVLVDDKYLSGKPFNSSQLV